MDDFTMELNSPLTEEQWDMLTDVDLDHTPRMFFHTKHGKDVEYVKVVRCKDCKYFELNSWAKTSEGIPIIIAHEICNRWGSGCKTNENGYCFMGERKEDA